MKFKFPRILPRRREEKARQNRSQINLVAASEYKMGFGAGITREDARTLLEAYQKHPWVYATIYAIQQGIAQVKWNLFREKKGEDGVVEWEQVHDHPILDIMKKPNPRQSWGDIMEATSGYLELIGNAYWEITGPADGMEPKEIFVPRADRIKPKVTADGRNILYEYKGGTGKTVILKPEEIIHFSYWNPLSDIEGMGVVEPLTRTIQLDIWARESNSGFFKRGARPDVAVEFPMEMGKPAEDRYIEDWEQFYAKHYRHHGTAFLRGGVKLHELARTQKDMEWNEMMELNRDEVMAGTGVTPIMLGLQTINFATSEQQKIVFFENVVKNKLRKMQSTLNRQYVPMFGEEGLALRPDLAFIEEIKRSEEVRAKTDEIYVKNKIRTVNEIRQLREFGEDVPWGDEPASENGGDEVFRTELKPLNGDEGEDVEKRKKKKQRANYVRRVIPYENRFERRVRDIFINQEKDVLREINEAVRKENGGSVKLKKQKEAGIDINTILLSFVDEGILDFEKALGPVYQEMAEEFGEFSIGELGIDFKVNPERYASLINQRKTLWEKVHKVTLANLQKTIREGVIRGETILEIRDRVTRVFDSAKDFRALRIARTEVIYTSNGSIKEAYRQAGVLKVEWSTAGDGDVDEDCLDLEALGPVPIEETFARGIPHPPIHPNCRCRLVASRGR